jgi:hypothetical protein
MIISRDNHAGIINIIKHLQLTIAVYSANGISSKLSLAMDLGLKSGVLFLSVMANATIYLQNTIR